MRLLCGRSTQPRRCLHQLDERGVNHCFTATNGIAGGCINFFDRTQSRRGPIAGAMFGRRMADVGFRGCDPRCLIENMGLKVVREECGGGLGAWVGGG